MMDNYARIAAEMNIPRKLTSERDIQETTI